MIVSDKPLVRTPVEDLFLSEMVMEDANFLITDPEGSDLDMVIDNTSDSLFADDDELLYDDEDEEMDEILGII